MAFERLRDRKTIATNLGTFIGTQLFLIQQQRQQRNLQEEAKFNQSVLEDNMTLEQQLDWRQNQLRNVPGGDREERRRVRNEIASLKDQIEQKKFTDAYINELSNMNDGMQSIDATMTWLNSQLSLTTDPGIQSKIRDEIRTLKSQRFNQQQGMIEKQTTYATNSQDVTVIDNQITKVKEARTKALNAGLDEYVSVLDLQLQTLNKSLTETKISKSLLNLSVGTATGQSSTALLDAFNGEIEKADKALPVTIGGTRYESAQQYWQVQRSQYLNDRSANGFFGRYQSELAEQVEYRESKRLLNNSTMTDVQNWYGAVKDRPELQDYQDRITTDMQKALQFTADKRATQIVNQFATSLDTGKALSDLAYLQDKFGVDQSLNYQKIIQATANEKEAQVREIISTMRNLQAQNPGMSNQEALRQAVQSGAGTVVTPEQLATQKATEIASTITDKGDKGQGTEASPLDITKEDTKPFQPTGDLQEGSYYKAPNSTTVYRMEGGKLRPFTGKFTEDEFRTVTGKDFKAVQTINSIAGIPTGSAIMKTDSFVTPAKSPASPDQPISPQDNTVGEYIPDPGLLQYYQPDQIISRGTQRFLKPGVNPVWQKTLTTDEQKQYKDDQVIKTDNNVYLKK